MIYGHTPFASLLTCFFLSPPWAVAEPSFSRIKFAISFVKYLDDRCVEKGKSLQWEFEMYEGVLAQGGGLELDDS